MDLKTKLEEMRKRCEAVEPLPNKEFPFYIALPHDEAILVNGYLQFGLDMRHELPALISALELCLGALYAQHSEWGTDNNCHAECSATCKAIASAEKILGGGE